MAPPATEKLPWCARGRRLLLAVMPKDDAGVAHRHPSRRSDTGEVVGTHPVGDAQDELFPGDVVKRFAEAVGDADHVERDVDASVFGDDPVEVRLDLALDERIDLGGLSAETLLREWLDDALE